MYPHEYDIGRAVTIGPFYELVLDFHDSGLIAYVCIRVPLCRVGPSKYHYYWSIYVGPFLDPISRFENSGFWMISN
jgi:hypothetical protein